MLYKRRGEPWIMDMFMLRQFNESIVVLPVEVFQIRIRVYDPIFELFQEPAQEDECIDRWALMLQGLLILLLDQVEGRACFEPGELVIVETVVGQQGVRRSITVM